MKKKRKHVGRAILIILTLAILVSTHIYYFLGNPFDLKLLSGGISGQAIAEKITENINEKKIEISFKEKIILGAEWILVIMIFLRLLIQSKAELKEYEVVITKEKIRQGASNTDLDTLYNLLKERKKLSVKSLAIYFKVEESTIISWARILEEANLLTIHYPNFGHPILILTEEVTTNDSK
ncbi:hypothetical protein J4423_01470 [Candidatus Pacearchaeota archaeon]|nr:hypothetical protein [Candidatus Pacearchaeota archaeon]